MANDVNLPLILYHLDLKLGISEKSIFHEFHPDAEDLFNVTCDLKLVCEKLRDRCQRHKRQVHFFLQSAHWSWDTVFCCTFCFITLCPICYI
ncbi:DNA ligase 4-like [Solanum stenotomum]|uniref:DNA ligase 4-like n=1 Tax=Solanum stenotomum TaxID=172797 RepID=UPI0020D1EF1F|nr:DNA ligase 4-like [Solanum stenotomum]